MKQTKPIMTTKELKEVLEQHKLWIEDKGGKRADFKNANLECADLQDANLQDAKLENTMFWYTKEK